nr:unknown [Ipomoea trifida]
MQLLEASQRPINILHVARSLFGIGKNQRSWSRRRRHTVDPDPVGPQLQARRPDQPKNGVLRHDVVRPPHAAARGGHAGRADDAAPHAPLHHRTRRVLDAHRRAPRVDAENPVEVGEVEVEDLLPAVLLDRPIYHGLHLLLVANVALYEAALVEADGLRHGDALLGLDVGDDDGACAVIGEKPSGGFPDAASTAGDYHNFVLEPFHGRI